MRLKAQGRQQGRRHRLRIRHGPAAVYWQKAVAMAELAVRAVVQAELKESRREQATQATQATGETVDEVIAVVSACYGVQAQDVVGHRRTQTLVIARHVAMYLCRKRLGHSYPELAREFGRRTHTTVMTAVRRVTQQLECDLRLRAEVAGVESTLDG